MGADDINETRYAQLGVRMDAELLEQLAYQAKKEERSMSQIVRLAIRQYISSSRKSSEN